MNVEDAILEKEIQKESVKAGEFIEKYHKYLQKVDTMSGLWFLACTLTSMLMGGFIWDLGLRIPTTGPIVEDLRIVLVAILWVGAWHFYAKYENRRIHIRVLLLSSVLESGLGGGDADNKEETEAEKNEVVRGQEQRQTAPDMQ